MSKDVVDTEDLGEKESLEDAKSIIEETIIDQVYKRISAEHTANKTVSKVPTGIGADPEVLKAVIKILTSLEKDVQSWFTLRGEEPEKTTILEKADLLDDNKKLNNKGKRHVLRAIIEIKKRCDSTLRSLPWSHILL